MADVYLHRGGRPDVKLLWCEQDYSQFHPFFGSPNLEDTPPYDSHVDGAYNLGDFTMGMPIVPSMMEWQRKAMAANGGLKVDDPIFCIGVPQNHYVTHLNFKIQKPDTSLAGATVALTAYRAVSDGNGGRIVTEIQDVEDAVAAQGVLNPIPLDKPCNVFVSLEKVVNDYVIPLYANPTVPAADAANAPAYGRDILLALKVVALPIDTNVTLDMARNGWYLSAKVRGFECPTHY